MILSRTVHSDVPVAVITGAMGGLGSALVSQLAEERWMVVAGNRQISSPRVETEILEVPLDVTDASQVSQTFAWVVEHCGRIDLLINNAAITRDHLLLHTEETDWDAVVNTGLKGAFLCSRIAADWMKEAKRGHIIQIGSLSGKMGKIGQANYGAAKAGLLGLTLALARELGPFDVCVNAVLPGLLPTKMTAHLSDQEFNDVAQENVLGRTNTLSEVARFIAFLARMKNVSGQIFHLDSRISRWA